MAESETSKIIKKCILCLWEKYFIICEPEMATVNTRNELTPSCRHSENFLLKSAIAYFIKTKKKQKTKKKKYSCSLICHTRKILTHF